MSNNLAVLVAFILIAIGIGVGFYFFEYRPIQDSKKTLKKQIEQLEKEISEAQDIKEDLAKLQKEYEELKKKLKERSKKLATQLDIPNILKQIEEISMKNHIKFKNVHFSPVVDYEGYSELPIELGLEGTYHDMGRWLADMENAQIVNINEASISISPKGRPVRDRDDPKKEVQPLNIVVTAKSYILHKGSEIGE